MIDYLGDVVPMESFETSKKDGLMSDDECCKILDIGKIICITKGEKGEWDVY
jgi:hypothetical protein